MFIPGHAHQFYGNRFIFDRQRAKQKLARFFIETGCVCSSDISPKMSCHICVANLPYHDLGCNCRYDVITANCWHYATFLRVQPAFFMNRKECCCPNRPATKLIETRPDSWQLRGLEKHRKNSQISSGQEHKISVPPRSQGGYPAYDLILVVRGGKSSAP